MMGRMDDDSMKRTAGKRITRAPALHRHIKERLERSLISGAFNRGKRLPSESEIRSMFGVSRHVVRMALAELAKEGLIRTEQGRGSFVNPPKEVHPITTLTSLHRLMAERKLELNIQVVRNRVTRAPRLLAERLTLAPGERVAELVRAAHIGGKPAMLMVSFMPATLCSDLRHQDMSKVSLYQYLERKCGISLVHAKNYIEVAFASREQGRHLGVPQGSSLLLIEGMVYCQQGRPVELSWVYYRADRFKLFFESSRPRGSGDGKVRLM